MIFAPMTTDATSSLVIRHAISNDVPALTAFARRVFHETFAADNDPADMAAYLAEAFSAGKQEAELANLRRTCLLAEMDGVLVGYACLMDGAAHAGVEGVHPVELERFYVDQAWHGRGIAAPLMEATIRVAESCRGDALWLGVWERNHKAIRFYRKWGFARVGAQTFRLGSDVQRDHVMCRPLLPRTL
jgi:diamine N-acetyltransferase